MEVVIKIEAEVGDPVVYLDVTAIPDVVWPAHGVTVGASVLTAPGLHWLVINPAAPDGDHTLAVRTESETADQTDLNASGVADLADFPHGTAFPAIAFGGRLIVELP